MYSTQAYLYQQRHQVIILDTSIASVTRRYRQVYSKKLTLNRGTDNVILFEFINQDQKPVNLSGSTLTFRIVSQEGNTLLLTQDLVIINASTGLAKITVSEDTLDSIDAQVANYSVERSSGVLSEPVFVDDDASARGFVDIVDSVYPSFVSSSTLTIPDQGSNAPSYTNNISTEESQLTFTVLPNSFVGNIQPQGATDSTDGLWYDIGNAVSYANSSARDYFNITGWHPYIRLQINTTSGNLSEITYR